MYSAPLFWIFAMTLLTRLEFAQQVFARSAHKCVWCGQAAVDAHHILERKLFADGGYYLNNGAAVCAACHLLCEFTLVSVEDLRARCGIVHPVLPPAWKADACFDKWGNRVWPSGLRSVGPLENDTGMRRALAQGGFLGLLMPADYTE